MRKETIRNIRGEFKIVLVGNYFKKFVNLINKVNFIKKII